MASLTRWTWVWVDSRSWWWAGRPGVLRFMGLQIVGHDWTTELNWMMSILKDFRAFETNILLKTRNQFILKHYKKQQITLVKITESVNMYWFFSPTVQFSLLVVSEFLRPHGLQNTSFPCPSPTPGACSNLYPSSLWCHPMSFPSSPAFSLSQNQGLFQWVSSSH